MLAYWQLTFDIRPNKIIPLVPITQPSLIILAYPATFYDLGKKKVKFSLSYLFNLLFRWITILNIIWHGLNLTIRKASNTFVIHSVKWMHNLNQLIEKYSISDQKQKILAKKKKNLLPRSTLPNMEQNYMVNKISFSTFLPYFSNPCNRNQTYYFVWP